MATTTADFLQVFKTTEEIEKPVKGSITGKLPNWLNGNYLRIGPGKYDFKDSGFTVNHVFDGYSIITKFGIDGKNSSVTLEKKYLDTEVYKKASITQKPVICEFGTRGYQNDPTKNMFMKLIPSLIPDLTDNCNMAIYPLGTQLIAGCETCHFHEINPNQLCSSTKFDASKLFGCHTFTCHPLKDTETGITYNFGSSILTGIKYNLIQIPSNNSGASTTRSTKDALKKAKILCSFPSSWINCFSYSHSFGMSKNYIIYIEQPYVLVVSKILAAVVTKGHCFQNWLEWRPELRNNFWIIEKSTGKLLKINYQSEEPFFFLHIINCYEDSGSIVIDLIAFKNSNSLEAMTIEKLRAGVILNDDDLPVAQRFVLPIVKNFDERIENQTNTNNDMELNLSDLHLNVDDESNLITTIKTEATAIFKKDKIILKPEILTERGLELPTINQACIGKKYKYFYSSGSAMNGYFKNSICKVNLAKKTKIVWKETNNNNNFQTFAFMGEPLFVPRTITTRIPAAAIENQNEIEEDDGIILCPATTSSNLGEIKTSSDFLLCLDAKSFKEIARVDFGSHIPQGLHGIFLPSPE